MIIKNGNDIILDNTNLTSHTISGLNANTAYTIKASASNAWGSSDDTTVIRYTNANTPTLSAIYAATDRIMLEIGNNSNAQNTKISRTFIKLN
jgi:DNA-binding beta-propeller fold protein YncE